MSKIYIEPYNETHRKLIFIVDKGKGIPSDLINSDPEFLIDLMGMIKDIFTLTYEYNTEVEGKKNYENKYKEKIGDLEGKYTNKIKTINEEHTKKIEDFIRKVNQNETEIEKYKSEIDRLKEEYDKTISIERTMKRTLENTLQEKDNAMKAFELNINNLIQKAMETTNTRHIEEIDRLMNQYNKEKTRFENSIQKLEDMLQNEKASYQALLREEKTRYEMSNKEEILRLESSNRMLIENMRILYTSDKEKLEKDLLESQEKIKELQENIRTNQASVIKGVVGQNDFFELIKEYTTWTGIEDTSKTSHAADLRGYIDKVETMFEVKNYSSDVPTKEVVKMIRDMETHSNICYGVFVSMNTGITGKKKPIEFQWTAHGQLCIFVSNLLKHDIEMIFNYIGQCASVAHRFFSLCNNEEKNELESYKDKLLQVKTIITKQITDISEMITAMGHHKKLHMHNLNKHYTEYKLMLEKMKISCNEIVDIVIGTDEVVLEENIVEPDATVSNTSTTSVVEKRKRKKKNEIMNDS